MTGEGKVEAMLKAATEWLDAVIEAFGGPSSLGEWRFWQGPAGQLSPREGALGDTTDWQAVTTPWHWSTAAGDVWFRTRVRYPEAVEGISTLGSRLEMLCTLLVRSRIYVNGQLAAGHDWWLDAKVSPVLLSESYQPGDEIEVACHIPQGDGLGGFGGASIRCASVSEAMIELEMLKAQLVFGAFLVRRGGDSGRRDAWTRLVGQLNWDALESRDWNAWRAGTASVVEELGALVPEAKRYVVHAVAHAHIDMNWLWPWEDTVDVIQRDFSTMDALMAKYPDFRFSQSQASTYWAMEVYRPDLLARVKERVREGRWEVTANTWVENDLNMSSGEATAHHFLHTRRYMRQLFGVAPRLVWEPDTFGHPATMPQIARKGGAEFYYYCRGGKDYPLFWWESADGSRILAFKDLHWYLGDVTPKVATESAMALANLYGLEHSLLVYGVGDHGGGATVADLEMVNRINGAPCLPQIKLDHVINFFQLVKAANPELPVVQEELNPIFAGCYTSHSDIKLQNRQFEGAFLDAETVATVAALNAGYTYPQAALEHHWRTVLFQQFHDILCGCGIGLTSKTARAWAEPAIAAARQITRGALKALNSRLNEEERPALSVFNTLPWERSDVVGAPLDWQCKWLIDDRGVLIPAQRCGEQLVFLAENVPPLGCRVYRPVYAEASGEPTGVWSPGGLALENELLRIEVDERSGAIKRFVDKAAGRDLAQHAHRENDNGAELQTSGMLNRLQVYWEEPHGMSAWKLGNISRVDNLVTGARVSLVEAGPVRGTIEVRKEFLHSSLVQRTILYRGSRRIDFETEVEWHERGSATADAPMLRVSFEPFLGESHATFQIPFGTIQRVADGQEVVAQMWADLSEADGGYGAALLNNCKYGYQAQGNTLRLSLIRASYEPDQNPDEGLHRFTYAFYPHPGSWKEADVDRRAQELNRPLLAQELSQVAGETMDLVPGLSALQCEGDGVALTCLKMAEDGDGIIVRLCEMHGAAAQVKLSLRQPVKSAVEVSLAEEPISNDGGLLVKNGQVGVEMKPHEIRTLRLGLAG